MSEFKVGNSVRLKEGLEKGIKYGKLTFMDGMEFDNRLPVIDISCTGNCILNHPIYGQLRYSDEMLDTSLSLSEIIERNYNAQIKRGTITPETTIEQFLAKLREEIYELYDSWLLATPKIKTFDPKELADITLVCFAMAKHYNIDLLKVMEEKTIFNENRED
jgi:NTP pyrophosphatase (non-canonical NTP hydrolase)